MKLSTNQAVSVMDAIIKGRIEKNRLVSKRKGQTKPGADYITEDGHALTRRVEIVKQQLFIEIETYIAADTANTVSAATFAQR